MGRLRRFVPWLLPGLLAFTGGGGGSVGAEGEPASLAVDAPEAPRMETLAAGQERRYQLAAPEPGRRYSVHLIPLAGDPDLYVEGEEGMSPAGRGLSSIEGPLQPDRVSFVVPQAPSPKPVLVTVRAVTESQYWLFVTTTPWTVRVTPDAPVVCQVHLQPRYGDRQTLVAGLTLQNGTGAWYEVTVSAREASLDKGGPPPRFVLGPSQVRTYPAVAFGRESKVELHADRTTRLAQIYLACDVACRLVSGGTALRPEVADAIGALPEQLAPLAACGAAFQQRDWRGGGRRLLRTLREHPEVFTALQQVLAKSGIDLKKEMLSLRLLNAFGGLSAGLLAATSARAPGQETVTVAGFEGF